MSQKVKRLAIGMVLAVLSVGGVRTIYPTDSQDISMLQLALDPDDPARRQVGALRFIAAWELRSRNDDFGGMSGIVALAEDRFVGIGDAGSLVGFGLYKNARTDRTFIGPLPNLAGSDLNYKDRDSEGIAFDPHSGQYWVSFEGNHAIRRYSASFARETGIARPLEMQKWQRNKGAEAIIRLKDGRFIIIAETVDGGTHPALLFSGDPVERSSDVRPFRFRPPLGFRVTDGVQLPDGRIAIINRALGFPHGFSAKISILHSVRIDRNATISASVIASLAPPLLVDNLEGIAVTNEGEDTFLWLISDNNFSIFQRTILMKFLLSRPTDRKSRRQ